MMIKALKYKLYSFLNTKTLRFLALFAMPLFLSGCEEGNDTSLGEEGNYDAQSSCWQTKITGAVTAMVDTLYEEASYAVSEGGSNVILVSFAVWMAFKLLRVLSSFKEESLGEVWNEILQKLFLCSVCAYIVSRTDMIDEAIRVFVLPIYSTILELATRFLEDDGGGGSFSLGAFGEIDFTRNALACPTGSFDFGGYALSLHDSISDLSDCLVCRISSRLNIGIKIALALIASLKIGSILIGLAIMALFTAAKFFFILFIVDSLFRLNFAAFLLPILIVGVPFKYTRKWSKFGFMMFLNSSGIMMFMALLIGIIVLSLQGLVEMYADAPDGFTPEGIEGIGTALLAMILISVLLLNIPGFAVALTDKFIGGGLGVEFQKKVSAFVMDALKKVGAHTIGSLSSGTTNVITKTMEKYEHTRRIMDGIKQVRNAANGLASKMDSLAGYNDDD